MVLRIGPRATSSAFRRAFLLLALVSPAVSVPPDAASAVPSVPPDATKRSQDASKRLGNFVLRFAM